METSEDSADTERKIAAETAHGQAWVVVRESIDAGAVTRQAPPVQLVTREVAARLAGVSLAQVTRWHSTGTGPRAYRVAGCWLYRAREVEQFIHPGARGPAR